MRHSVESTAAAVQMIGPVVDVQLGVPSGNAPKRLSSTLPASMSIASEIRAKAVAPNHSRQFLRIHSLRRTCRLRHAF